MTDWKYIKSSLDDMIEHSPEPEWLPKWRTNDDDIRYSLWVRDAYLAKVQRAINFVGSHPDEATYLGELTQFLLSMAYDSIVALTAVTGKGYLSGWARTLKSNIEVQKAFVDSCLASPHNHGQSEWNEEADIADGQKKEVISLAKTIMEFQPSVEFDWKSAKDIVDGMAGALSPYRSRPLPIDAELDGECSIKGLMEALPRIKDKDSWDAIKVPSEIVPFVRGIVSYWGKSKLTAEHPTNTEEASMTEFLKKTLKPITAGFSFYIGEITTPGYDVNNVYAATWVFGILHSCADLVRLSQDLTSGSYLNRIALDIKGRADSIKCRVDDILSVSGGEPDADRLGVLVCDIHDVICDASHLFSIVSGYNTSVEFDVLSIDNTVTERGEELLSLCDKAKFAPSYTSTKGRLLETSEFISKWKQIVKSRLKPIKNDPATAK